MVGDVNIFFHGYLNENEAEINIMIWMFKTISLFRK